MQTFSIGRDANNQMVLNDKFVSRKHAQLIILDNGQIMIKDSGSSNGTFVNGIRVNECYLKQGDIVKCASVFLNWQDYALSSSIKTSTPVSSSSQVAVKQPDSSQMENIQNIFSDSSDLPPKPYNDIAAFSGQNQPQTNMHSNNQQQDNALPMQQNVIVIGKAKSVGTAFILAFFFGPLGLLYASVTGGVIMFILAIPALIFTAFLGIFFINPICSIWAVIAANQANASLQNKAGGLINNNFRR
jgi:hypothetical protein